MIILKLTDGLGNQMFQYAYARCLQIELGENKLYLDITKLGGRHVRKYALNAFILNKDVVIPSKFIQYFSRLYVKIVLNLFYRVFRISTTSNRGVNLFCRWGLYTNSAYYHYFPFVRSSMPIRFVRGFFQNEAYFKGIKPILVKEFQLNINISNDVNNMARCLETNDSVCVHIRRGDFIGKKEFNVCNESYYLNAIAYIRALYPSAKFYIFSNTPADIEWIKSNYKLCDDVVYMDNENTDIEDFYLMKSCGHFIISNSTFSWWAAYLSENDSKVVVAPRPWVNDCTDFDGIYCKDWVVLDVN